MTAANYENMSREELILLLREVSGESTDLSSINHPQDALPHLAKYAKKQQENFVVLLLDSAHRVIKTHHVSKGIINRSIVHPREVFREAIRRNAAAIIVAHNHPSGNNKPSPEDDKVTQTIVSAGKIIGISVLDSLIVTKNGHYYSYLEKGRL